MRPVFLATLALVACKPPVGPVDNTPTTLTVVGINDFHGALYETPTRGDPTRALGGLPVLAGAIDALRADTPDLVLLDGGDEFQGSWPVNATRGMGSVRAMNLLGLDAGAVGNHEFDYGGHAGAHPLRGALEDAASKADYHWLSANVYEEDGSRWQPEGFAPWTVIERKGLRIGVVGLSTVETPQTTLLVNVADLSFHDTVDTVRALGPELEAADLDVTVLVAHLTGECDLEGWLEPSTGCTPDGEIGRLLTELPPGTFDVMVLGHAHTLLSQRVGDTFVLEAYSKGQALNRVDLVVGPDGVDPDASVLHPPWGLAHASIDPGCEPGDYPLEPLDVGGRTITPSAEALALVRELEAEAGSLCTEVGCNDARLTRSYDFESPLGDYVADAMLSAFDEADLAIQNSGGLRSDLPAGTTRREHLQAVMPFDNRLYLIEMSGADVELMLQIGSSGAHGILQVAGGGYHFDPAAEGGADLDGDGAIAEWETDRLCTATIGEAPLDPEASYRVVITDFLLGGGDHLGPALDRATTVQEGPLLREVLYGYTEGLGACIGADGPLLDPESPRVLAGPCGGG